jgi:hypothetical protein
MNPLAKSPPLPEQSNVIRAQYACDVLSQILSPKLYLEVRTEVCQWDVQADERSRHVAKKWRVA